MSRCWSTCVCPLVTLRTAHRSAQFDQKAMDHYESDSDDVDESLTVPRPPEDEVSIGLMLKARCSDNHVGRSYCRV